jgi:hypothetical protein
VAVSLLLAFAGAVQEMRGVLLWPAVALHAILAAWCVSCLRSNGIAKDPDGEAVNRWTTKK